MHRCVVLPAHKKRNPGRSQLVTAVTHELLSGAKSSLRLESLSFHLAPSLLLAKGIDHSLDTPYREELPESKILQDGSGEKNQDVLQCRVPAQSEFFEKHGSNGEENPEGNGYNEEERRRPPYRATGSTAQAREALEKALSLVEPYADAHLALAGIAVQEKDPDNARRHYARVLELDPSGSMGRIASEQLQKLKEAQP